MTGTATALEGFLAAWQHLSPCAPEAGGHVPTREEVCGKPPWRGTREGPVHAARGIDFAPAVCNEAPVMPNGTAQDTARARESWTSKLGVVLAVSGSAVGLGNFLRFPGEAVSNGGGAFMLPYLVSLVLLGIPICWAEWTMGRLGGRFGQNSPPGICRAL